MDDKSTVPSLDSDGGAASSRLTARALGAKGSAVAAGTIMSAALAATISPLLAKSLGAEGLGAYSFVLATSGVLAAVAGMGVGPLLIRNVARERSSETGGSARSSVLEALAPVTLMAVLLAILLLLPTGKWMLDALGGAHEVARYSMAILVLSMAGYSLVVAGLRSLFRFRSSSFLGLPLQRLLVLSWIIVMLIAAPAAISTQGAILATAAAATVSFVVASGWLLTVLRYEPRGAFDHRRASRLALDALPLTAATTLRYVAASLPIWVLTAVDSFEAAGVYALAMAVTSVVQLIQRIATDTLGPFVARALVTGDVEGVEVALGATAALATVLTVLAGLVIVPVFAVIGPSILGGDFRDTALVAAVLLLGTTLVALSGSCGLLLSVGGQQRWIGAISGIQIILLLCVLVPAAMGFGAIGGAIAVTAGTAMTRLMLWHTAKRTLGVDTHARFAELSRARLRTLAGR